MAGRRALVTKYGVIMYETGYVSLFLVPMIPWRASSCRGFPRNLTLKILLLLVRI